MNAAARVLLIDDDENLRQVIRYNLEKRGFQVTDRPDGEQGLVAFSSDSFDIVITDMTMPGMSSMDVLGRVKALRPGSVVRGSIH